jgi:hypothetical protein
MNFYNNNNNKRVKSNSMTLKKSDIKIEKKRSLENDNNDDNESLFADNSMSSSEFLSTKIKNFKKIDFIKLIDNMNQSLTVNNILLNDIKTYMRQQSLNSQQHLNQTTFSKKRSLSTADNDTESIAMNSLKKTEVVVVKVRIIFLKIGEIDTIKENFQAEILIQVKWKEKGLTAAVST